MGIYSHFPELSLPGLAVKAKLTSKFSWKLILPLLFLKEFMENEDYFSLKFLIIILTSILTIAFLLLSLVWFALFFLVHTDSWEVMIIDCVFVATNAAGYNGHVPPHADRPVLGELVWHSIWEGASVPTSLQTWDRTQADPQETCLGSGDRNCLSETIFPGNSYDNSSLRSTKKCDQVWMNGDILWGRSGTRRGLKTSELWGHKIVDSRYQEEGKDDVETHWSGKRNEKIYKNSAEFAWVTKHTWAMMCLPTRSFPPTHLVGTAFPSLLRLVVTYNKVWTFWVWKSFKQKWKTSLPGQVLCLLRWDFLETSLWPAMFSMVDAL